ncbi:MAG TPA: hypothetical protein P5513_04610 [Candidatus Diapherotrites archaeon]|nr:hypothetical protein [Candidatus Diapherotrites archaeon]
MKKGLKTELKFKFRTDDLEIPNLNFTIQDPPEKERVSIKIIKKKKKSNKKNVSLF